MNNSASASRSVADFREERWQKCFLSCKLAYYNDFWRIMWSTLKTGVLNLIHFKYILNIIKIEKSYLNVNMS